MLDHSQTEKIILYSREAGEIAIQAFKSRNFEIRKKSDGSKVTSADIAISKFLREKLTTEFPQIPVICEEGDLRKISAEIFFLVDPIDGTASFISGSDQFCINIALIKNRQAIFGLIYAPLFEGGKLMFCDKSVANNEARSTKHEARNNLRIITSSRSKDDDIKNCVAQLYPDFAQNFSVEKLASAIKFFRILEGKADAYLHLRKSMEWDSAAGQALVELMGGKVKNLIFNRGKFRLGEGLVYKKPDYENNSFIAYGKKIYGEL